jgi:hypothetical protein
MHARPACAVLVLLLEMLMRLWSCSEQGFAIFESSNGNILNIFWWRIVHTQSYWLWWKYVTFMVDFQLFGVWLEGCFQEGLVGLWVRP